MTDSESFCVICPSIFGRWPSVGVVVDEQMREGPPSGYRLAVTALAREFRRGAGEGQYWLAEGDAVAADDLLAVHDGRYVEEVARLSAGRGGEVGPNTHIAPGGYDVARRGVGAAVAAVDAVLRGAATRGYALSFPAGHHAVRDSAAGWCVFNNVAVAVRVARSRSVRRVMIIDLDVHHGNGTQSAFWDDPTVLTLSVHQDQAFEPMTGGADATGGEGAPRSNLNVTLPAGAGLGAYQYALDSLVDPVAAAFRPELIVVSGGVDASAADPMGRMRLHVSAFYQVVGGVRALADRLCDGRIVVCLEGGYSAAYSPLCALATAQALAEGGRPPEDPFLARWRLDQRDEITAYERRVIDDLRDQLLWCHNQQADTGRGLKGAR